MPSQAEEIYDMMLGLGHGDKLAAYKEKLVNEILPGAFSQWGYGAVKDILGRRDWKTEYAMNIARSMIGLGPPVYNRTGDGSESKLVYVKGFAPQGAPLSISGTRGDQEIGNPYGNYDEAGRYLGFRSGLIGGRYVY